MENIIISRKEYSIACKEVLEILKKIKQEDLEKIPNKEVEKLKENASNDYEFTYDLHKNIKMQNVSKTAKAILANFFIDYIASEEQKKEILNKQKYDLNILEQEKIKKYEENNIFASKKQDIKVEKVSDELPKLIKKETFWDKVIKYIRKVFKV